MPKAEKRLLDVLGGCSKVMKAPRDNESGTLAPGICVAGVSAGPMIVGAGRREGMRDVRYFPVDAPTGADLDDRKDAACFTQ